jgi:hypothetical protein
MAEETPRERLLEAPLDHAPSPRVGRDGLVRQTVRSGTVILGLGCILFIGTVIWIATFPVHATI